MEGLINKTTEATASGMKAIQKFEGTFSKADRVAGNYGGDQVQLEFEDVVVLEMQGNEPAPDLNDDKLIWWMSYAAPNQSPKKTKFVVKGLMKSAEALWESRGVKDKGWLDLLGERVVMEQAEVELFKKKNPDTGELEPVTQKNLVFALDGAADDKSLDKYVTENILGLTPQAAKRFVLVDPKVKHTAKYRDAFAAGTFEELLGVSIGEDGLYTKSGN